MKILILYFLLSAISVFGEELTLINGTPANPKEWEASVYASMGGSRCSATVIGKRVLLIAAHCVGNGAAASFSVGPNRYTSTCTHSPHYRGNATADWALCKVTNDVTGIAFEAINQDENRVKVGEELTLTGYGCIRPGGGGGNDGIYRIGKARVVRVPSANGVSNDIETQGGAALCFGDSGGPAFYEDREKRWVVSVNSRGDIRTKSSLSAIHTDQFKSFLTSWVRTTQLEICGVTDNATGCRNAPPVPTGKAFEIISEIASVRGVVNNSFLDHYENIVSVFTEFLYLLRD